MGETFLRMPGYVCGHRRFRKPPVCVCVCVAQGVRESNRMAVTDLPQKRQPASFYGEQIDLG